MKIGHKYIIPQHTTAFIFIGFNGDGDARFVADNQALFDLIGEPYSVDAILRFANQYHLDKIGAPCSVVTCDSTECNALEDIENQIETLTARLQRACEQRTALTSTVFYATDMPGGELYNQFIQDFISQCNSAGIDTSDYTFHGTDDANTLNVCHNDWGKTGEDNITEDSLIFFAMKKRPEYARINARYMLSSNIPRIK